jgi:hypothetical protein
MTVRRMAGACQPSHRWYRVFCGGMAVIVRVLPIASSYATAPGRQVTPRSLSALRTELLAALLNVRM